MALGTLLKSKGSQLGLKPALFCGDREISYKDLDTSTTALGNWFLNLGLRAGERVAIHRSNSIETVQIFFALFKAGLIAVPINTRLKASEIAYELRDSGAAVCFTEPSLTRVVRDADICPVSEELPQLSFSGPDPAEIDIDHPCAILYTSGTTARPKGVVHSHRTILENARLVALDRLDMSDTMPVFTQMMHASGLYCNLLPAIYTGIASVLLPAFEPGSVLDALERFHCTCILTLPTLVQLLLAEQIIHPRNLRSIRTILCAGDSVPVSLQEKAKEVFGTVIQEGLFMTETLPVIVNPRTAVRPGSLGIEQPGVAVRIVDAQDRDVPDGEIGEIVVQSPANCIGYWNNLEATRMLLQNGWLHSGDLGCRDSQGYYWFKGRKKQIIIRGGANISPQEIEEVLYGHPDVLEVGVVGLPDALWGERVIAIVKARKQDHASEGELRDFACQALADYKLPERIIFIGDLPRTPTGKVDRRELRERLLSNPSLAKTI